MGDFQFRDMEVSLIQPDSLHFQFMAELKSSLLGKISHIFQGHQTLTPRLRIYIYIEV